MKDTENFLDKHTLLAILLIFVGWVAWDSYMRKKYPASPPSPKTASSFDTVADSQESNKNSQSSHVNRHPPAFFSPTARNEQEWVYKSPSLSFVLSSQGMGFKFIVLNQVLDRKAQPIWLFASGKPSQSYRFPKTVLPANSSSWRSFETRIMGEETRPLYFKIKQVSPHVFEGVSSDLKGVRIKKTLQIEPKTFLVTARVEVSGALNKLTGISTLIGQTQNRDSTKNSKWAFFSLPDELSYFISSAKGIEQIPLPYGDNKQRDPQKLLQQEPFSAASLVAVGSKYFGQAWIDKSDVLAQFQFFRYEQKILGLIKHSILNYRQKFVLSYHIFMGPKSLDLLTKHPNQLVKWVDFGWFGALARAILQVLQFFHSWVQNWGLSIILLTVLVRLLLLPLVLSSHRSMEVMKTIQPEIKKIRQRFKSDPQRMNQEIMAMMKAHRANPLGGCLPMLCQIPIFWALWKALANSYSLYRSPFVFWIQDLSWKDPYYILPIGIGALMFVQQRMFPASLSPEMTRAMQILPIFMVFFMINLPSGLTLYVFVSSLFGLIQQFYLNKLARPGLVSEVEK